MSKTKLWSLQFSCRRLAREARSLGRTIATSGGTAREIEQHLATAAQLIQASMDQLGEGQPTAAQSRVLDVAQLAFGDNAWANQSPMVDYKAPAESAPTPQHKLGMRTAAQFFAMPDLVTFLCSMKKTGVLLIDTQDERFTVELDQGDIVHAHSDGAPEGERLGDVLVENGVLAAADLDTLLAEGIRGRLGGRLGARLLERGLATQADLVTALETQIRRLFHRLFTAEARECVFWEGPCVWGDSSMRLNATMLLLDGARAIDESHRSEIEALAEGKEAAGDVDIGADGSWLLDADHAAASPAPAATAETAIAAGAPSPAPAADAAAEASADKLHQEHPLSPTPKTDSEVEHQDPASTAAVDAAEPPSATATPDSTEPSTASATAASTAASTVASTAAPPAATDATVQSPAADDCARDPA